MPDESTDDSFSTSTRESISTSIMQEGSPSSVSSIGNAEPTVISSTKYETLIGSNLLVLPDFDVIMRGMQQTIRQVLNSWIDNRETMQNFFSEKTSREDGTFENDTSSSYASTSTSADEIHTVSSSEGIEAAKIMILGTDFLLAPDGTVWLLEINACPAIRAKKTEKLDPQIATYFQSARAGLELSVDDDDNFLLTIDKTKWIS